LREIEAALGDSARRISSSAARLVNGRVIREREHRVRSKGEGAAREDLPCEGLVLLDKEAQVFEARAQTTRHLIG
jgi:hypothetical protein